MQCRSPRMSSSSISSGSSPSRAASSSPRFSRSSGGDVLHAQPLVDLLLGGAGVRLAVSSSRDAVLAHVQPAPHGLGAQRLVVLPRAGEVLEQVPEASSGTTRRSTGMPDVGHGARAGLARGVHLVDLRAAPRRPRTSASGSAVAATTSRSLHGVGHAARAAGQLHPLARAARRPLHDRLADAPAPGTGGSACAGRRRRPRPAPASTFSCGLGAEARHVGQPARLGGLAQLLERGHAEVLVQLAHALRPEPRDARDLHEPGRELRPAACRPTGSSRPRAGRRSSRRSSCRRRPAPRPARPARAPPPTRRASRIALAALR